MCKADLFHIVSCAVMVSQYNYLLSGWPLRSRPCSPVAQTASASKQVWDDQRVALPAFGMPAGFLFLFRATGGLRGNQAICLGDM